MARGSKASARSKRPRKPRHDAENQGVRAKRSTTTERLRGVLARADAIEADPGGEAQGPLRELHAATNAQIELSEALVVDKSELRSQRIALRAYRKKAAAAAENADEPAAVSAASSSSADSGASGASADASTGTSARAAASGMPRPRAAPPRSYTLRSRAPNANGMSDGRSKVVCGICADSLRDHTEWNDDLPPAHHTTCCAAALCDTCARTVVEWNRRSLKEYAQNCFNCRIPYLVSDIAAFAAPPAEPRAEPPTHAATDDDAADPYESMGGFELAGDPSDLSQLSSTSGPGESGDETESSEEEEDPPPSQSCLNTCANCNPPTGVAPKRCFLGSCKGYVHTNDYSAQYWVSIDSYGNRFETDELVHIGCLDYVWQGRSDKEVYERWGEDDGSWKGSDDEEEEEEEEPAVVEAVLKVSCHAHSSTLCTDLLILDTRIKTTLKE
mmetsp:Transcript_105482/g.304941  ORF Transcript_105482/g.304941 Transcript_105482/m.304941 type:complete len:444 (-) Transcript_105482:444-1775(-)